MIVRIRPLEINDAYTSVRWRNDPEVFKYTGHTYDHEITLESELNWVNRVINNRTEYRCAIIVDDIYVGNIYLTDINQKEAQYHIFIGEKKYWGKGIASLASKLIISYGFNNLGLDKINLKVHSENISAIKLYESLGFKRVGNIIIGDNLFILMTKLNDRKRPPIN